ncbi:hypothetical protein CUMW_245020 [Citrus unshiu]|nr:hypothetical protein CUMW_245020 [Citrus unshiu]
MVYDSLDDALFEKNEKFKTTQLKNPDHNIEKYNLYGFTFGVQAWIYEAIGGFPSTWVVKTKNKIPRIVQWKPMASSRINFAEVYLFFNDESRIGDVLQTLEPNSKESNRKYWLIVKDYMPSIPDWVHKFGYKSNTNPQSMRCRRFQGNQTSMTTYQTQHHSSVMTLLRMRWLLMTTRSRHMPILMTHMILSFYGDVSGESVQVFSEVPPGVSKFGCAYIPSYVYNSPYMIPPLRRGKNARPIPRPQIMDHAQDMNTSVDINPRRGLEDSSLFANGSERPVPAVILSNTLGLTSMGWLGNEHIHEYLRLISEKQRQYPNALVQRVTHTDTFFWNTMSKSMTDVDMLLIPINLDGTHWVVARVDFWKNKVWIYDSLLTFHDDKRYKLKFKPLEVIFSRWLEYVGFYNIRPELRSADPWKVIAVKSAPQQEPGTGDCGVFVLMVTIYLMSGLRLEFNASHVEYFRKNIAVDIFNDDIIL